MMKTMLALAAFAACGASAAHADCLLSTGPCSTDSYGNTYRSEQNLGGGVTTYKNGRPFSTTTESLNGGYREEFRNGGSRNYNDDPFPSLRDNNSGFR